MDIQALPTDFRETLSAQPNWWAKSHQPLHNHEFDAPGHSIKPLPLIKYGRLRHQRISIDWELLFGANHGMRVILVQSGGSP